uniref:Uncharacterized protein n=1 Tax=Cacopsylla melanoneura TaxID=428564 RepID=A0A8D8ZCV1_9HEMI
MSNFLNFFLSILFWLSQRKQKDQISTNNKWFFFNSVSYHGMTQVTNLCHCKELNLGLRMLSENSDHCSMGAVFQLPIKPNHSCIYLMIFGLIPKVFLVS